MPRYVAFLRAINVGGHIVKMDELKRQFEKLGFEDVSTFIASGNVVFSSPSKAVAGMETKIEAHLLKAFGYEVRTFVRSDAEVAAVAAYPVFNAQPFGDKGKLHVAFVADPIKAEGARKIMALESRSDRFHVHGKEIYWLIDGGFSDSKLNNAGLEKAFGERMTVRGINTVIRITAKYGF